MSVDAEEESHCFPQPIQNRTEDSLQKQFGKIRTTTALYHADNCKKNVRKEESVKKSHRKLQFSGLTIALDEQPDRDEIIQSSQKYKRIKLINN